MEELRARVHLSLVGVGSTFAIAFGAGVSIGALPFIGSRFVFTPTARHRRGRLGCAIVVGSGVLYMLVGRPYARGTRIMRR